jgi:hypothetical protein
MLHSLESVVEAREERELVAHKIEDSPKALLPSSSQTPFKFSQQESWDGNVQESPFASFSSLSALEADINEPLPVTPPTKLQMYGQTGCKTHTFNLEELDIGIAEGGSLLGNKISKATRQENALAGLLLAHINGKDKRGTSEEAFDQFREMRGSGGGAIFEKHEADIMRLLETRSNERPANDEGPAIRKVQVAQDSQAMILQNKSSTPDSKNYKLGVMRKPLREIWDHLSSRIKDIKGSRDEWDSFEETIGRITIY